MDPDSNCALQSTDEIDLRKLLSAIWMQRRLVFFTSAGLLLMSALYLHMATYKYSASMKVVPVEDASALSRAGGLAGLAAMAGMESNQPASNFDLYVDGLTDLETTRLLAADQKIMRTIFSEEWDEKNQTWHQPSGAVRAAKHTIKKILGYPDTPWRAPDAARLKLYLSEEIEVSTAKKSNIITISYENQDPLFARHLISRMHEAVDTRLRKRAMRRADASIGYVNSKLPSVSVAEYRQALVDMLSTHEKQRMLASSGLPFAADPIAPAEVSASPVTPKPALVIGLSLISGIMFSILIITMTAINTIKNK